MPLRFDHHQDSPPRRPLVSRSQWRLLSLVAGLALVIVMMQVAQSPSTKRRLELLFGETMSEQRPAPIADPAMGIATADYFDGIDSALLDSVEDNTVFRDEESDAWFHLFEVARAADPEALKAASLGEVARAQLIGQPEFYRGRVVTIRGVVRRTEITNPAPNELGIDKLYRVILQPHQDARLPFTLYCIELPAGWTTESPQDTPIVLTGFFFKNWVYGNQVGVDLSPVIVANSMTPIVQEVVESPEPSLPPAWQLIALAAAFAGALVAIIWVRGKPAPRPVPSADVAQEVADSLCALDTDGS
ncbi:MAG: hypothetical protein ACR2NU_11770 [Aeoliella sp.]